MTAPAQSLRPFRFGVQASRAASGKEWVELARRAEGHGYSTLTMPDHFDEQLAPVPALAAAATATDVLRVGALVWDNDYKHPVVLTRELATMDVLSDGRVEVGLGAGWKRTDYDEAGLPYDAPGVRVDRFAEAITVMKGLFIGRAVQLLRRALPDHRSRRPATPGPAPWPPFLIGAGGKRMLGIAAREADIVGINPNLTAGEVGTDAFADMMATRVDDKIATVRAAAGDRLAQIELNVRAFIVNVTTDRTGVAQSTADLMGITAAELLDMPFTCVGTPAQIAEDLRARRERWGFSYVIVGGRDIEAFAPSWPSWPGRSPTRVAQTVTATGARLASIHSARAGPLS